MTNVAEHLTEPDEVTTTGDVDATPGVEVPHVVPLWPNGTMKYPASPSRDPRMSESDARLFLDTWNKDFMPEAEEDGTVKCPLRHCDRIVSSRSGFKPHWSSHRTEAEKVLGLPVTPSRAGRKKGVKNKIKASTAVATTTPKKPTTKADAIPDVSVAEGLAAVLTYSLGRDTKLPVDRVLEVHQWLNASSEFIDSLRG